MKVLLVGAFGNIGSYALQELIRQGHDVLCFDLETKANKKMAKKFARLARAPTKREGKIEIVWGNLSSKEDVEKAVSGQEIIVHLAALIPPQSERRPAMTLKVNVGGTLNLLQAMKSFAAKSPKIIFASSVAVFGRTQALPPPRKVSDKIRLSDYYTLSKALGEKLIKASGLEWTILRFGAVLPPKLDLKNAQQFKIMFQIPLEGRIEFLHYEDAGLAIANALGSKEVWGKILLIGGGRRCQFYQGDIIRQILNAAGIGMLPEEAFGRTAYYTDWLDTEESQKLLNYQRHSFDDFIEELVKTLGWRRYLVKLCRHPIRKWILKQSPYLACRD